MLEALCIFLEYLGITIALVCFSLLIVFFYFKIKYWANNKYYRYKAKIIFDRQTFVQKMYLWALKVMKGQNDL